LGGGGRVSCILCSTLPVFEKGRKKVCRARIPFCAPEERKEKKRVRHKISKDDLNKFIFRTAGASEFDNVEQGDFVELFKKTTRTKVAKKDSSRCVVEGDRYLTSSMLPQPKKFDLSL
jgi:hypothetical protein